MKKIALLLLILAVGLSIMAACRDAETPDAVTTDAVTTDAVTTDAVTTDSETTAPETEVSNVSVNGVTVEGLNGWFEYGGALIYRDKYEYVGTRDSMEIAMAKNEMEGFQYLLLSGVNYDGLRVEVSTLTDRNGNTLEGTTYVAYNFYVNQSDGAHPRGYTPEILMPQDDPYQGGTFDVVAKRAKTLYVQFKTDANTVPGTYTGRLEVKQGDTVLKAHDISVKVWDIYYSEKTECITMYCCGYERNDFGAGGPGPDSAPDMTVGTLGSLAWERRRQYYDFLLENRLSPIVVPLEGELLHEDFEAVKKYMNNPRFTAVQLNDHSNLETQIEVAKENGWYDKLLFSLGDEPDSLSQINEMKKRAFVLTERTGITRFNASFGIAGGPGELWMIPEEGPNVVELMSEYTTFFTINAADVIDGPIKDSLLKLKFERGDTVLWYVCGPQGNRTDLINHLTCTPGTEKRILFWQQYQNDIDGFLGFQTTRWNTYEDPWAEDYEERKFRPPIPTLEPPTGDGIVVFWHPETGAPLGSLTLEANRDGIEDFQLLRMAEYTLGKEVAMAYAERITTANNVYTKDASLLAEVRQELGDALEAALAS